MTLKFNRILGVDEIHVPAKFHEAKCSGSWVINSELDFGTAVDFDREYLWKGSSNREAENGVMNCEFFPHSTKKIDKLWSINDKGPWSLTTLKLSGFRAVVKEYVHAKFHRAKCSGSWAILSTKKKNSDENNTLRRYRADSKNTSACKMHVSIFGKPLRQW